MDISILNYVVYYQIYKSDSFEKYFSKKSWF